MGTVQVHGQALRSHSVQALSNLLASRIALNTDATLGTLCHLRHPSFAPQHLPHLHLEVLVKLPAIIDHPDPLVQHARGAIPGPVRILAAPQRPMEHPFQSDLLRT